MRIHRRHVILAPFSLPLLGSVWASDRGSSPMNLLGVHVDDVRAEWGEPDELEGSNHPEAYYRLQRVTIRIPNFWENRVIVYFSVKFPLIEVPFTESRKLAEPFVPEDREPVGFGISRGGNTKVFRYNSKSLERALDRVEEANSTPGWKAGDPGDFTIQPSPFYDRPETVPETFVMIGFPEDFQVDSR